MWIAHTPIGIKRLGILLVVSFFVASAIKTASTAAYFTMLGGMLVLVFFCIYLALQFGIYVRKHILIIRRVRYEVRDYFMPFSPNKAYRELCRPDKTGPLSQLYYQSTKWAMFDEIREIITYAKPNGIRSALVLGGGGGSVPYELAQEFPVVTIDVVEISKEMIAVAKSFFAPLSTNKNAVNFYRQDAFHYVQRNRKQYDFVFVDIFSRGAAHPKTRQRSFIKQITSAIAPGGITVVNFGFSNKSHIDLAISAWRSFFPRFTIRLFNKNVFGIDCNRILSTVGVKIA